MMLTLFFSLLLAPGFAAIYGPDDRRDINQVPHLREEARAVAIAVPKIFVAPNGDGTYQMRDVELLTGALVGACEDERFARQPTIGNCTAFWVGGRYLVTAGHCVLPNGTVDNSKHPLCDGFSWYFDFNLDQRGRSSEGRIREEQLYSCTRVIRAENFEYPSDLPGTNFGPDFAVIELDREVSGGIRPLKLARTEVKVGDPVFTIGHPSGLPAKFSGTAPVLSTRNPLYFEVNLDTLGGNSGGPVFNAKKEVVGILVSGHPIDYYQTQRGCYRVNTCDQRGQNCKENSRFPWLQVSNYVQHMRQVLPYLRR
jgi:V8-like Glu-specific endopeptidase